MDLVKSTGTRHTPTQVGDLLPAYFLTNSIIQGNTTLALTSAAVDSKPYSVNLRSNFKVRVLGTVATLTIWDGTSYVYYPNYTAQSVMQETEPSGLVTLGASTLITHVASVAQGTKFMVTDQNNFSFFITII